MSCPAKIPEFYLVVKVADWKVPKNRAPPHSQSTVKQAALFSTLLRQGIIRKSNAAHYSQLLLVPKPDQTFRMCVDYRTLNDWCELAYS